MFNRTQFNRQVMDPKTDEVRKSDKVEQLSKRKRDCDDAAESSSSSLSAQGREARKAACTAKELRENGANDDDDGDGYWGSPDVHRALVAAIFEEGLKHSSPSVIMENMVYAPEELTSERVKSHLQKFRKSHTREKQKFMEEYNSNVQTFQKIGTKAKWSVEEIFNKRKFLGGKAAAFTAHSVMTGERNKKKRISDGEKDLTGISSSNDICIDLDRNGLPAARIKYPILTQEETKTPLGVSLMLVMGIIEQMEHYISRLRNEDVVTNGSAKRPHQEMTRGRVELPVKKQRHVSGSPSPTRDPVPLKKKSDKKKAPSATPRRAGNPKSNLENESEEGFEDGGQSSSHSQRVPHDFQWRQYLPHHPKAALSNAPLGPIPPHFPSMLPDTFPFLAPTNIESSYGLGTLFLPSLLNQDALHLQQQQQQQQQVPLDEYTNDASSSWLFGSSNIGAIALENTTQPPMLPSNYRVASLLYTQGEESVYSEKTHSTNGEEFFEFNPVDEEANDLLEQREEV